MKYFFGFQIYNPKNYHDFKRRINRLKSQKMFNKLQKTFKTDLNYIILIKWMKWMNQRETNKEMFHPRGILADEWIARQFKHWSHVGKSC